jgi:hypothetical protein
MKPMKFVLGALALGCLASDARAIDSPYSGAPRHAGATAAQAMSAPAPMYGPEMAAGGYGCNTCAPACDPCGGGMGGLRFIGGAGLNYVQPRFHRDPGFSFSSLPFGDILVPNTDITIVRNANFPNIDTNLTFAYEYEMAPRFWLGVATDCGCGGRFRFWSLDTDATKFVNLENLTVGTLPNDTAAPIPFTFQEGSVAVARGAVAFEVYDFEGTYESNCCGWWLVSCGVRYLQLRQNYDGLLDADLLATANGGTVVQLTQNERVGVADKFEGLGPTVALETRFPTDCFNIAVYFGGRISLIVGHGEETAGRGLRRTEFVAPNQTTEFTAVGDALRDRDDIIGIGELELGLETIQELEGVTVFGRVALVAQSWWDVVIPTDGIVPGNAFNGLQTLNMRNRDKAETDLNIFGVSFVGGFKF